VQRVLQKHFGSGEFVDDAELAGVCTENPIRIDWEGESRNVSAQ
jgi:hypothetical protein